MTDNEIIKGLKCCNREKTVGDCDNCPYNEGEGCLTELIEDTLDLINRQKEEIVRLKKIQQVQANRIVEERGRRYELANTVGMQIKAAISEAIREYAEKLKENLAVDCDRVCERSDLFGGITTGYPIAEVDDCIDNLVKEMAGESNDT